MPAKLTNTSISVSEQQEVMLAVETIYRILPFLINLSKEERRTAPSLGDKSRLFVQKAMEIVNQNSSFLPRSFDVEEMRREVGLYEGLYPLLLAVSRLHEMLEDTYIAAGKDAYDLAREVYSVAKSHHRGVGAEAVDQLGTRFSRKTRKTPPQPPQA